MTYLITNQNAGQSRMPFTMAVNFDFAVSENCGYVDNFDKVQRIIREHELNTTSKFSLFKAPKDFGRKGKATLSGCI